jgi:hypothetical protein
MSISGKPASVAPPLAGGEQDRDPLREEPASEERKRARRRIVQPLGVVDHAEQRAAHGRLRQQTEYREPDEERLRCRPNAASERDREGLALGIGQALGRLDHRGTQLLKGGIRKLHLPFHPSGANDREVVAELNREVEESGLARAGLSVKHQRRAVSGARVIQQALEDLSLPLSAEHRPSQQPRGHIGTLAALGRFVATAKSAGRPGPGLGVSRIPERTCSVTLDSSGQGRFT